LIVVNVQTGTPSNPSEALENVGIAVLVGPILADTDDAVEEVVVGGPILVNTDDAVEEVVVGGPILVNTDDAVEEVVVVVGGRR
jgi:hypothetical protein